MDDRRGTAPEPNRGSETNGFQRSHYSNIPDEMLNAKRWLLWKSELNPDPAKKPRKVPYYSSGCHRSGVLDSPEDAALLATFKSALRALESSEYTGLGFALGTDGAGNNWQGIDLDNLPDHPELDCFADSMPGYVEESPSGKGLHSIGYGRRFSSLGSNKTGIEAYSYGRYFTVTGKGSGKLADLFSFVEDLLKPMHGKASNKPYEQPGRCEEHSVSQQTIDDLRSALAFMPADDRELWQRMGHALKTLGHAGRNLWLEWSRTSDKFDPNADAKTWESFEPAHTNHKVVFTEAQSTGWQNPARKGQEQSKNNAGDTQTKALIKDADATKATFKLIKIKHLIDNPVPLKWTIKGIFEQGGMNVMSGMYGSGKSFIAFDMAFCVAAGLDWQGHKTNQAPVVVLAGEGHSGIADRFAALAIEYGIDCPDGLYLSQVPAQFTDRSNAEWVADAVNSLCPDAGVVVVDTMNRNFGLGDENSTSDMTKFVHNVEAVFRTTGKTVLIVHHAGHNSDRGRGSIVLPSSCEGEFFVKKQGEGVELACQKQKNAPKAEAKFFKYKPVVLSGRVDEDGEPITSLVLEATEGGQSGTKRKLSARDDAILTSLQDAIVEHGVEPPTEIKTKFGGFDSYVGKMQKIVNIEHWRKRAYECITTNSSESTDAKAKQKAKQKAFNTCRDKLFNNGFVVLYGDYAWRIFE